ncbi:MAG: phosphoserine aminotransferase, partial [Rhodospirillaceae bacterium]|nr:phosphoserine aminotransferase [Rhodospirillaceae bacterium]
EDALDGLNWGINIGGLKSLIGRSESNLAALARWVENSGAVDFLAEVPETRSCTSVCIKIVAPWFTRLSGDDQGAAAKRIAALLDAEGIAFDIDAYRDAPPGLRIWAGATIETSDLEALSQWIDWALSMTETEFAA